MTLTEIRLKCIIDSIIDLGGESDYPTLYVEVKKHNKFKAENFASNENMEGTIRKIIQEHSSDSKTYNPQNPDIFYSVGGIRSGIWGLRKSYLQKQTLNKLK